jgi:hypothetical protein
MDPHANRLVRDSRNKTELLVIWLARRNNAGDRRSVVRERAPSLSAYPSLFEGIRQWLLDRDELLPR